MYKKFAYLMIVLFPIQMFCLSVGSNSVFSRQAPVIFPSADTNNTMLGFAVFEQGFSFEDRFTTCTFNDVFPTSGQIMFNAGRLYLLQDLVFANTTYLGTGAWLYGNSRSAVMPDINVTVTIPYKGGSLDYTYVLNTIAKQNMGAAVQSVDWHYTSSYVAAASLNDAAGAELRIYSFDGSTMSLGNSTEQGRNSYTVRWNPKSFHLAFGRSNGLGNELITYLWNPSGPSLTATAGRSYGGPAVNAVAWHPSGTYLLAGLDSGTELNLYNFSLTTGALTNLTTAGLTQAVGLDALSWAPGGNYVVVGTANDATVGIPELFVYSFNGTTLTLTTSAEIGANVKAVDWCPTGSYVAVGTTGGTQQLRIYQHTLSPQSIREQKSARVGEVNNVRSVNWDRTGTYLVVGIDNGISSRVDLYRFDKTNVTLTKITTAASATAVNSIRWSRRANYLVRGNSGNQVIISNRIPQGTTVNNISLVLRDETLLGGAFAFEGNCKVNGGGNRLKLYDLGMLLVKDGAKLVLEDIVIDGLADSNIRCLSNNSSIVMCDVRLTLTKDFTFATGSILFDGYVEFVGPYKFNYTTALTSSIATGACLLFDHGFTFNYAPSVAKKNLLYFQDSTSKLYLDGCSLMSTRTGLQLDRGMLILDNAVTLSSQGRAQSEIMQLGSTLDIRVLGNAMLNLFGTIRVD